ncbi:MAG: hypothetical protein CL424_05070 [Acidimicrobiaceae bacterium]|nr:hypothetical protein [Acidimicrobiaceae bacterium]
MKMFTGRRKWQDEDAHWIKRHSLSLVLGTLLLAQTIHALFAGAYVWNREQPLGKNLPAYGSEFWIWWSWEYNVSLVADTFGVLLIVMLSKWLYEEGSAESSDTNDSSE